MPTASQQKALKDGLLTQKQYDKLPSALLDGIIKSKRGGGKGKKKPMRRPTKGGAGGRKKPNPPMKPMGKGKGGKTKK